MKWRKDKRGSPKNIRLPRKHFSLNSLLKKIKKALLSPFLYGSTGRSSTDSSLNVNNLLAINRVLRH